LNEVSGKVVTESGVVPVTWKQNTSGGLDFTFTVPAGVTATLSIPAGPEKKFTLNSVPATGKSVGERYQFILVPGDYIGTAN
jgi:hypothetical protein